MSKALRGVVVLAVSSMVAVSGMVPASAEPAKPAPLEQLGFELGGILADIQDLNAAAGSYCGTKTKMAYQPLVGPIDTEILNWGKFYVILEYCYTVNSAGTKTFTSADFKCDHQNGPNVYYDSCSGSSGYDSSRAWASATGYFYDYTHTVTTWEPQLRVEKT